MAALTTERSIICYYSFLSFFLSVSTLSIKSTANSINTRFGQRIDVLRGYVTRRTGGLILQLLETGALNVAHQLVAIAAGIMSQPTYFLKKLFDPERPQTIDQVYTEWAESYDNHVMDDLGCKVKDELVKCMMAHIKNRDTTMLLDLAAGTGITAQLLRKQGYKGIMDGLESNIAMLKEAEKKGIYRQCIMSTISADEELPDTVQKETYDGIMIAGGFVSNHIQQGSLVHIIQALKPAGVIVFNTRNTGQMHVEYRLEMDKVVLELVREGEIEIVEERNVLHYKNLKLESGEDLFTKLYVCKKL